MGKLKREETIILNQSEIEEAIRNWVYAEHGGDGRRLKMVLHRPSEHNRTGQESIKDISCTITRDITERKCTQRNSKQDIKNKVSALVKERVMS